MPHSPTDRFNLYRNDGGWTLLQANVPWPRADGEPVVGLAPNLQYNLRVPAGGQPTYNPLEERVEEVLASDFTAKTDTYGWEVVPLTANEIRCNRIFEGIAPIFYSLSLPDQSLLENHRRMVAAFLKFERDADAARQFIVDSEENAITESWDAPRSAMLAVFDTYPA